MKKKGIWVAVSVLLVFGLLIGVFGCKAKAPEVAAETVKVACLSPLSGPSAAYQGANQIGGMRLAIKEINDAGGILGGRMVEGIEIDEGYTAEEVISAYKEALSYGVKAIVAGTEAGTTEAALPIAMEADVFVMCGYASCLKAGEPGYWHGVYHIDVYPEQWVRGFKGLVDAAGAKTVAILQLDGGYGYLVTDTFEKIWPPGADVEIIDLVYWTYGATDIGPEVTRVVAGNPDAINLGIWAPARVGEALKKLRELGYTGIISFDIDGMSDYTTEAVGADLTEGTYGIYIWLPDETIKENWEYAKAYEELNGFPPAGHGTTYYTAMKSVLLAMDKAGTADDTRAIAKAMNELDFVTPWGNKIFFFPDGGQMYVPYAGMGVVKDGKFGKAVTLPLSLEKDYNAPFPWYDLYKEGK